MVAASANEATDSSPQNKDRAAVKTELHRIEELGDAAPQTRMKKKRTKNVKDGTGQDPNDDYADDDFEKEELMNLKGSQRQRSVTKQQR